MKKEPLKQTENKSSKIHRLFSVIRSIFSPHPKEAVNLFEPTLEQSKQVENALKQSLGIWTLSFIELLTNERFQIEHSSIDTREVKKPTDILFQNITGAWGRGPECEAEIHALATAMGNRGLYMNLISLPGHGETTDLPDGWDAETKPTDFELSSEVVAKNIENLLDNPQRPVIINAWSMGGITALKTAANHPELVNGLILIDTPVFPMNFKRLVLKFFLYAFIDRFSVKKEKNFDMNVDAPGLMIFYNRIRDRNKKYGTSLSTVFNSAMSLAKQDLVADGTLDKIAENAKTKKMPILILRGSFDLVVPHEQTTQLYEKLRERGVDVQIVTIEYAGHSVIAEQPIASAKEIEKWLLEKELLKD